MSMNNCFFPERRMNLKNILTHTHTHTHTHTQTHTNTHKHTVLASALVKWHVIELSFLTLQGTHSIPFDLVSITFQTSPYSPMGFSPPFFPLTLQLLSLSNETACTVENLEKGETSKERGVIPTL